MEFGKITPDLLEQTDFALPPDPAGTRTILEQSPGGKTRFYVGCAKWGRKDWVGKLYPPGTPEKDFLKHYAKIFNSIEFNGFYYSNHSIAQVKKWRQQVPPGFRFCPKFTQSITHYKRLKNAEQEVDAFLSVIEAFGEQLGPVFLMPHPQMGPEQLPVIKAFLEHLPADLEVFLELRHPDFFASKPGYLPELYAFLRERGRGTVITDAAGRRDCVHMHLSTPECFIRFVGNALHPSDYWRIDDWVERIAAWARQGLKTCYFFMHQHDELHSPELIRYFIQQLNQRCETGLTVPPLPHNSLLF
jgi:uncharacterized protein YecE (DUF72 family)